MKALFLAISLAALAIPALAQEAPVSLVGTWTGHRERMAKVEGWIDGTATLVITEQKGLTFKGNLTRSYPNGPAEDGLWGAFTPGGRLMVAADEEGTYSFNLVDASTLDYCYTETASPRAVCARLTRQK